MEGKHIDFQHTNYLRGGGEMGERIRAFDWSKTALGPVATWPQSLRTILSVMLNSKFPMFLYWGPELICFYNDAFRPSLGIEGKHPASLGKPAKEFWAEAWQEYEPIIGGVKAGGEATWDEDQLLPIYRNGKMEDVYWTYSLSPVYDESAAPGGVLLTCIETTQKVITMARLEESRDELNFAIEATELATWDLNPVTNKLKGNNRLKEWFGLWGDEEVELEAALDAIAAQDRGRVIDALHLANQFSSGGGYDIEYTIVHPLSKQERYVRAKGRTWFNEGKVAYRFTGTLQDITPNVLARKRLEESESRFRNTIEQIPLAVGLTRGNDHIFEDLNPSMLRIIGKEDKNEVIGKEMMEVLPELKNQPVMKIYQGVLQTGVPFTGNEVPVYVNVKGKLELGYYTLSYTPLVEQGKITGIIHVAVDVTEMVLARQRVEKYAQQLQASEQRFRLFVQASNDTLYRMSPDWQQMLTLEGKDFLSITDKPNKTWIDDYLPPEEQAKAAETIQEAIRTKGIFELEHRVIKADGSVGWTFSRAIPVFNQQGEITEWFGAATDITEQKLAQEALKESEQRFRIMADASPAMIWALNPDASLKYANTFMLRFLGISLEKLIEDNWVPYLHPEDLERTIHTIWEAIAEHKPFRNEHRFLRHDGQHRWLLSQGAPSYYANSDLYGYVGSSIDITQIKETEIKLQGYAGELAAANEELSAANEDILASRGKLEKSNSYLLRVNSDLDNFIYTASHDLKAPINNIEGLMHMLKGKMKKKGWEDSSIYSIMDMMDASIIRFKKTVADLADISKAEEQLSDPSENVDLARLISDILLDLQIPIEESNAQIELQLEACAQIVFSKTNLKSVLYNLISNAIKYRDNSRKPHITITCRQEEAYRVLSVADNGLGLNTADENKIFGMFRRQHTHVEGTGVGLYIVKKIIENAGGKITVESKIGEGSVFRVYIKGDYL